MVMIGKRSCLRVERNILPASRNFKPMSGIEIIADRRMAVPDADK
jgi:hypothetical protein